VLSVKNLAAGLLIALLPLSLAAQSNSKPSSPLGSVIARFELQDATLVEGVSKLSSFAIPGLHLGMEEILDNPTQRATTVRFSLKLNNATVREVLNQLCKYDGRYTWALDGQTVNIYPGAAKTDGAYLMNLHIDQIEVQNIVDPFAALEPLHHVLPNQQLGYSYVGASPNYPEPWTVRFENLTVRQYINRITERVEPNGGWVLQGAVNNRFFAFFPNSFK